MNSTNSGSRECDGMQKQLDSYVSGELSLEVEQKLRQHIENCRTCEAELAARQHLRSSLQRAVSHEPAPSYLRVKIKKDLSEQRTRRTFSFMRLSWAAALTALVIFGVTLGLRFWPARGDFPSRVEQDAYISRISMEVGGALRAGLSDHVHCAVFRKYPAEPPSDGQLARDLGEFSDLLPQLSGRVPPGYRLFIAHRCSYRGRNFIHLAFRKGSDLISLVITRKQPGESLSSGTVAAVMNASGVSIYGGRADRFEIAGFDSGDFVSCVVSDLPRAATLETAANLAPAVRDFLRKL